MNNPARKSSPRRLWTLYTAAVLLMSVSCKKEQPNTQDRFYLRPELDCESANGNCCISAPGAKYQFVTELKDEIIIVSAVSADVFPYSWVLADTMINNQPFGGFLCQLGLEKLKGLSPTPIVKAQIRVSGKVYANRGIAIFCKNCFFPYDLSIEKAELVR